jgi:glycosyltransferase involved in cell wall biosynthesis
MRIAIVINTSWNIWNFRMGLIDYLIAQGHEVLAIAPEDGYSERLNKPGCQYVSCKMDNKGTSVTNDLALFLRLRSIYKAYKPELLLHYTIKPNVYGTLAAATLGLPAVSNISGLGTVFLHQRLSSRLAQWLYRFSLRFTKHVFFQNEDDLRLFQSMKLVNPAKCSLLPGSGINLEKLRPLPMPPGPPYRFLMASRILYDKGAHHFAEAAMEMKAKGYSHEFVLQGFTDFGSKAGIPLETLKKWGASGALIWKDPTDRIEESIKEAHIVVLPSYREGTPRSLLEAAALGRPIITTDVPGCREVVQKGKNGLLCEPYSTKHLVAAMEEMASKTLDELREMARQSREIAEAKFDEQIVFKAYTKVIKKLAMS